MGSVPSHSALLSMPPFFLPAAVIFLLSFLPSVRCSLAESLPYVPYSCPSTNCYVTFSAWFDSAIAGFAEDEPLGCPPGCLDTVRHHPVPGETEPHVWGRYPYHFNSSVCLAAIHAGVINEQLGGRVFSKRFLRYEWTNDSRETVFPFNSSLGSYSNGVHSRDVPPSWHSVPAGPYEQSATVLVPGGLFVHQRRLAPFAARAGHSQVRAGHQYDDKTRSSFLLIVGGHNATHYLNVGQPTPPRHPRPTTTTATPAHTHCTSHPLYSLDYATTLLPIACAVLGCVVDTAQHVRGFHTGRDVASLPGRPILPTRPHGSMDTTAQPRQYDGHRTLHRRSDGTRVWCERVRKMCGRSVDGSGGLGQCDARQNSHVE